MGPTKGWTRPPSAFQRRKGAAGVMDHLHGVLLEQVDCLRETWSVHDKDGTEDWMLAAGVPRPDEWR